MPVTSSDLILYLSQLHPTNDTDPAGGSCGTTEITDATIGEYLPSFSANPTGGDTKTQRQKSCLKNNHATDTFYSPVFYFLNSIDDLSTANYISVQVDDSTDASNSTIRILGQDTDGDFQSEDIEIGGTTSKLTGVKQFNSGAGGLIEVLFLSSDSGAIKNLSNVDATISDGDTELGIIPEGFHSAHANLYMFIEGTLNSGGTSTNRLTDPGAAAWTKPRTSGDGEAAADNIGAGDYQGIWIKEILYAGMSNISDAEMKIMWYGSDA